MNRFPVSSPVSIKSMFEHLIVPSNITFPIEFISFHFTLKDLKRSVMNLGDFFNQKSKYCIKDIHFVLEYNHLHVFFNLCYMICSLPFKQDLVELISCLF